MSARAGCIGLLGLLLGSLAQAAPEDPPPPEVRITAPLPGQTRERVVTIQGTVRGVESPRLRLVLGGVPLSIPRDGETFSTSQVLAPGPNAIRVEADVGGRVVSDEIEVHALVPAKDLRVTLTWDTPGTDVDLWVTGPDGEKVFYGHRESAAGGTLDTDVTTGYGPETYTQAHARAGTYHVQAHYYRGGAPTRIEVTIVRGEGSPEESREVVRGVLLAPEDVLDAASFTVLR